MRRVFAILFFLGVIAFAVVLAVRLGKQEELAHKEVSAVSVSSPPPPATPLPPPRLATPSSPDVRHEEKTALADEQSLMRLLRASVKSEPAKAEALAREARRRFPDGAEADERDALLVDSLINQQRIGAARDETYYYFEHHPGGRFGEHLFVMTGVRPPPRRR